MSTPDKTVAVTAEEFHTMVHSTAWTHGRFRNHFTTDRTTDDWPVCTSLVAKGLMTQGQPDDVLGGMTTFRVSDTGLAFLRKALP
jgi:hypothetical protein